MLKKKKVIVILALIVVLCFAFLCNSKWGKEHVLYPFQAKQNAIKYIKEKYGFKPKVIGVDIYVKDNSGSPIPFLVGKKVLKNATLEMEYEGKKFKMYISWGDTKESYDTYQNDEIEAAVKQKLTEVLGECARVDFTEVWSHVFYNGKNLSEVLESTWHGTNAADIYMVDADLSKLTYDEMVDMFGENCNYCILNCKDREGFEKIDAWETDGFLGKLDVEKYTLYCKDYIEYRYTGEERRHYEPGQCGQVLYQLVNGTYCNAEKGNIEDLSAWDPKGKLTEFLPSDRYVIDTDAQEIILFVPCEVIEEAKKDKIRMIQLYTMDGNKEYHTLVWEKTKDNSFMTAKVLISGRSEISFVIGTE